MHRLYRLLPALLLVSLASISLPSASAEAVKHVLVTGTSTGIGRNLTERLVREGHHVYAGVRSDEDYAELDALDGVTAVMMDVTRQDQVDAVASLIRESGTGLYALVNNAGIGGGGPIIETPLAQQTRIYAVNVEGVYRVTRAFAPLVIEARGRIVTTGSIAGTVSWAGGSAYAGSKHWIEAFTDSLAAEMEERGVSVSVIEPGNYQTHIRRNAVLQEFERVRAAGGEISDELRARYEAVEQRELSYKLPDDVSDAYMHALFDPQPLRRYVVTPNQQEQDLTIATKIDQLLQLNTWGPYSYSRDELVALLDQRWGPAPADDRAEIEATLRRFLAGVGERAVHDAFWAEDLVYTSSSGERRGKAEILAGFDGGAPERYRTTYGAEDLTIRLAGDIAVVTFRLTADEDGRRVGEYFNSGVFRRTDTGWRAFTWQATQIPGVAS